MVRRAFRDMVRRAFGGDMVRRKRMARKRMAMKKRKLEEEAKECIVVNEILSEDEKKKKLVYIFMHEEDTGELRLVAFDPHEDPHPIDEAFDPHEDPHPIDEEVLEYHHGSEQITIPPAPRSRFVDKTSMIMKNMPPDLLHLIDYQFAALGSKLYFIGGLHSHDDMFASDRVFAFDMASQAWEPNVPCMKLKRAFSTVVTYENKIYVFGYDHRSFGWENSLPHHWAEFFDPQANTWNYLPGPPAPEALREGYMNLIAAVLEGQKKVLLCIQNCDVYSYSFVKQRWRHEKYSAFNRFGLRWSTTVAVVKDTLFWNYFGNILAFDFQPQTLDPELKCTIPKAIETFGTPSVLDGFPGVSFLVHAGNGKLCLVYDNQHVYDQDLFRCHTFQLRRSHTSEQFDLHYEGCQTYQTKPPSCAAFAMAM